MVTTLCGSKSMTLATPMLRSLLWFRSAKVETGLRTGTRGSRDQSFIFRLFFSQLGKRPGAGTGNGALMAFAIATQVVIHAIADASALKSAQQKFANLRVPHAEFHLIDVPHPTPPHRPAPRARASSPTCPCHMLAPRQFLATPLSRTVRAQAAASPHAQAVRDALKARGQSSGAMDVCRGLRRRLGVPFAVFAPTKQRAFTIDHSRAIFDSSTGRGGGRRRRQTLVRAQVCSRRAWCQRRWSTPWCCRRAARWCWATSWTSGRTQDTSTRASSSAPRWSRRARAPARRALPTHWRANFARSRPCVGTQRVLGVR